MEEVTFGSTIISAFQINALAQTFALRRLLHLLRDSSDRRRRQRRRLRLWPNPHQEKLEEEMRENQRIFQIRKREYWRKERCGGNNCGNLWWFDLFSPSHMQGEAGLEQAVPAPAVAAEAIQEDRKAAAAVPAAATTATQGCWRNIPGYSGLVPEYDFDFLQLPALGRLVWRE